MADMVIEADKAAPAPRRRALPFKRTVSRAQQPAADANNSDDENNLDFFRRSRDVFPEILQEAGTEVVEDHDEPDHDRKRRKLSSSPARPPPHPRRPSTALSASSDDDDVIMDVKGKGKEIIPARRPTTPRTPRSTRATPKTPASATPATTSKRPPAAGPITIIDSDSDSDDVSRPPSPTPAPNNRVPSTPPLPRTTTAVSSSSSSSSPLAVDPPTTDPADDDFSVWTAKARALRTLSSTLPSASAIVNVIITSPLVDASVAPVAARRRLNQTVQAFLEAWLDRAGDRLPAPRPASGELFLTWKGRKVYGGSSLAEMGVRVDAEGRVRSDGGGGSGGGSGGGGGEGYYKGGIHLEVWSEALYADFLLERGRRRERAIAQGLEPGDDDDDDLFPGGAGGGEAVGETPQEEPKAKKKGIRIVLKAKDHEPLKLTTRDETNVETLVEAFRTQRGVGEGWEVSVWFDGERLEEDTLVTDIDIDPDEANQLEVHVKKV